MNYLVSKKGNAKVEGRGRKRKEEGPVSWALVDQLSTSSSRRWGGWVLS
jgi:hypothetical protein